jgi:hypothetical protein
MCVAENMFWGRGEIDRMLNAVRPRSLRLTIRHTDWYHWESDQPLRFQMAWLQRLLDAPYLACLETFILELETLDKNKDQLKPIVDSLITKESTPRRHFSAPTSTPQKQLRLDAASQPRIWYWTGPSDINEKSYRPYKDIPDLHYRVEVLTWKSHSIPSTSSDPEPRSSAIVPPFSPVSHRHVPRVHLMTRDPQPFPTAFPPYAGSPLAKIYAVRVQLLAWDSRTQLPYEAFLTRREDVQRAELDHEERRQLWLRGMAEMERRRLRREWTEKRSLLEFESDEEDGGECERRRLGEGLVPVTPGPPRRSCTGS